jgi:tRNA A37 threonylcarbamoyladenosine dehydratase
MQKLEPSSKARGAIQGGGRLRSFGCYVKLELSFGLKPQNLIDQRQFAVILQLYGDAAWSAKWSHVVVAGIGGVGFMGGQDCPISSRSSFIDMDHVSVSNINRQVHALHSTLGSSKIDVMAARLRDIQPNLISSSLMTF